MKLDTVLVPPITKNCEHQLTYVRMALTENYWEFVTDGPAFHSVQFPAALADNADQAITILKLLILHSEVHYVTGQSHGRAEAQRHLQLALGVVKPTYEEAALWNNPIPLRRRGE